MGTALGSVAATGNVVVSVILNVHIAASNASAASFAVAALNNRSALSAALASSGTNFTSFASSGVVVPSTDSESVSFCNALGLTTGYDYSCCINVANDLFAQGAGSTSAVAGISSNTCLDCLHHNGICPQAPNAWLKKDRLLTTCVYGGNVDTIQGTPIQFCTSRLNGGGYALVILLPAFFFFSVVGTVVYYVARRSRALRVVSALEMKESKHNKPRPQP